MAIFKFRLPGRAAAGLKEPVAATAPNLEEVRRRARYRLLGAVVLVFVAVVGFPLVFDSQPRPVSVDTPILMPDRQTAPPLAQAASGPAAPAAPLLGPDSAPDAAAPPAPETPAVAAPVPAAPPAAAPVSAMPDKPAPAADKPLAKPADKAAEPVAAKPPEKAAEKAAEKTADKPAPKASEAAAEGGRYVVQVGAWTDAARLREVRRKLEAAGFKTYTQEARDKDGKPTTRVRIGPFASQDEARKAGDTIKKMNLPVGILKL